MRRDNCQTRAIHFTLVIEGKEKISHDDRRQGILEAATFNIPATDLYRESYSFDSLEDPRSISASSTRPEPTRAKFSFPTSGLSARRRGLSEKSVTCHLLRAAPQCGKVAGSRRESACRAPSGRKRMRLRAATRSWLILEVGCWRPDRGLSGSACREPWGPRREAITYSCCRNAPSSWTAPTCDRTWPVWILTCIWIYCTPRPAATSGYVSSRLVWRGRKEL